MIELGIYIAGPLYSSGDLVTNTRAAIDAAHELEQAHVPGVKLRPFVPHVHALTWTLVHGRGHSIAQDWDDFWLSKCAALLRLPGFSRGTTHEVGLAYELRIPCFQLVGEVLAYARSRAS